MLRLQSQMIFHDGRPLRLKIVREAVLVEDAAIRDAQLRLWRELRVVAEPSGATALAALTSGAYKSVPGERVGVMVCGSNVDLATLIG